MNGNVWILFFFMLVFGIPNRIDKKDYNKYDKYDKYNKYGDDINV